jgi:4-amino-4-deoxy-L-arabinose transferase-like glycosyltransferase
MNWLSKRLSWILILASAALFYLPLGSRALWNSDEGRYAEIAREMLELKDWISPHLNYVLYFEKPPLMYWLTAASLAVFGQNEFAARFWCATFGLFTVCITYLLGKHWKGERAGLLAGGILATSLLFFVLTQFLVLDMALTFWLTLALYAASRMLMERLPDKVKRYTDLLALAMAGGILTKGLVALVFPVLVLALTVAYTRLWGQARKMSWQPAFILTLFITAPWFVVVSVKHPIFPYFFFIHEHVARFLTTVHHRTEPFYFFIVALLAGFFPWTVFLPAALAAAFKHHGIQMKRDPVLALLVIWSMFVLLFFSVSQSKLVGYILPVFPALALVVAGAFDETFEEERMSKWVERGVVALIVIFVAAVMVLKLPQTAVFFKDPIAQVVRSHGDALSLLLGCGVSILVGVWGMRQSMASLGGVMIVQVLLLSALASLSSALDPYLSNKGLARILAYSEAPGDRVICYAIPYEDLVQSLLFYAKRRIVIQGPPGELELGRDQAADAPEWFLHDPGVADAFRQSPKGTWVVTNEGIAKLVRAAQSPDPFDLVGREGELVLLHKVR